MRIQPITTLDDLDTAIASAEKDHQSRWYVARVAQAMGCKDRIPASWVEHGTSVETFREDLTEAEHEAVSEHLSAVAAEVDAYTDQRIGLEDLEDAALAASIASGDYAAQFETGLVASVGTFVRYDRLSEYEAEAIVAAAKKPRKVRTQAGVRRFKQPIGTVILPGGKILRPGDKGYDAADKAAGGGGGGDKTEKPNTSSGSNVKARIDTKSPTTKADRERDTKNTSGQRNTETATTDTPIGQRPDDKKAAKIIRSKMSELSKAKTAKEIMAVNIGELLEIEEDLDVHPDVKRMSLDVRGFKSNKYHWQQSRNARDAKAARSASAGMKAARTRIQDGLAAVAGKKTPDRLDWQAGKNYGNMSVKASPNLKGDVYRDRSSGKFSASLIHDNQTVLDKEYTSLAEAQQAVERAIKKAQKDMNEGKSPKVIDPEVVAAEKRAAKAEKAAEKAADTKPADTKNTSGQRSKSLPKVNEEIAEVVDNSPISRSGDKFKIKIEVAGDTESPDKTAAAMAKEAGVSYKPSGEKIGPGRSFPDMEFEGDAKSLGKLLGEYAGYDTDDDLAEAIGERVKSAASDGPTSAPTSAVKPSTRNVTASSRNGVTSDLAKKHGVSETAVTTDLNSPTGSLKSTLQSLNEGIAKSKADLRTATGSNKTNLESNLEQQRKRAAVLNEIIAARDAGNVDFMRTEDAPVDQLPDDRLQAARDQAVRTVRTANRPSWKRAASANVKKYNAEIERRKSSGDNNYSEMSDSELKSRLDLAAAAVNAGDDSLFDKGHAIKQELKRRGIDYKPNSASSSTEDRKADVAARAAALGDKPMTPGRLNQRIRTVNKHLKGVQDRIKARKDRGLNPTKAQLRDEADLKNQLKELNARKSGGGSDKSVSSAPSAAASPAPATKAPATNKQSLNSSAQSELADFADKMGKRLDSVNVKSLDKFIDADDDQIDPDLKTAARRLKVAHDNLKKSKRKNRNRQDKMIDVRNYSEARDHARKLLEKSKNNSGTEKSLGNDSTDKASKPASKSRIAPATSEYKTTDTVPHSVTKKVQQQFAGSYDRPDAKDIMTLNDSQLSDMLRMGFQEDYYDEGVYKIFGTAESWAEYYARQDGLTLSPEQRERVGNMVLGADFRSTQNMSDDEYGDYMIDANDGIKEANRKLDERRKKAGGSGKA